MTNLGSNPRKSSRQSYAPIKAYCLLSIDPEVVHVHVLNRGGKFGSVSAIHRCGKIRECLNRQREVDLRFRASIVLSFFGWSIGRFAAQPGTRVVPKAMSNNFL